MKQVNYAKESKDSAKTKSPLKIILDYIFNSFTIAEMEVRKLRHDPTELLTRAVQPVLWLLIFGQAFSRIRAIPTGNVNYQTFMAPGILAQSMMFISIFYGLSIIWDKDQGILQKLIAMPVPRAAFVTGKAFGAGVRAISQVIIILFLSYLLGLNIKWSLLNIIMSIFTIILGAAFFSSLSMALAAIVKSRERFMGIGQVITMPLFFASNAIYPIQIMPHWLQIIAKINPLSYVVELLRGYLINGSISGASFDWLILILATVVIQVISAVLYPHIVT
ncbi:ABC transporter permease [Thermoanaerobacterium thermosaccharolyticum]|uniref:Transport permease protein n=1 Tax=Thermoanaerobacterium thermosaccharolyticum TaxID=1517 RepID=A0A223HV55_THETR|nr:ABC transporter permease [Thermoanaerobacterium thermosaccharolyticum]AST56341.1 multidrug ABC transporter permease [Thermoanaerobacterium thermosaccharolyticum]PHO08372.1 multidrug ABC transporter permease [Thermoanaerobacterium thermosaccharolyticum]